MTSSARAAGLGLGLGRLAIGAGLWLAPRQAARALGFDELDSRGLVLGRLAGTRDFLLGLAQLSALGDPPRFQHVARAGMVADAADAIAFAAAISQGERVAGLRGLALAVPATVLGFWLARSAV